VRLLSTIGATQNLDLIRKGDVQVADAAYDNEYLGCAPRSSAAQTTSAGRSKAGAGARRRRPDATIGRDPALRQPAESDTMVWPVGARRDAAVGWEPAARSHPHPTSSRSRISGVQTAASQRR
jgi:hypothetical protein